MIRLFIPTILATTMLTAVTAQAAGGLYKHDASIAQYNYNVPIVDGSGALTQSGTTLRQDLDKGYKPSAQRAAPIYQKSTSENTPRPASAPAMGQNGNAGVAANLQGIAQGGAGAQGSVNASPNNINAGGSVVSGAATTQQAPGISPTAPIGRNSTDSIRSQSGTSGMTSTSGASGANASSSAGGSASATVSNPLGNSSASGSSNASGAADGGSGFTGDASNSGSTSTSNGGVGGSNGGSSSVGGGSSIGNASGGSLGGGAGAGAGAGGGGM